MPNRLKQLLRTTALLSGTLLMCLLMAEVVFSTVIPACRLPNAYYDDEEQILRFDTDSRRDGLYTVGRFAQLRGKWHINDQGWISEIDYVPREERAKPLIAVFGDSYVEALQVDVDESLTAILRRRLEDQSDVYSFAISGAPLSQYVHLSRHASRTYDPDVLVFVLIHNDFPESIRDVAHKRHCLQVDLTDDGIVWRDPAPYVPSGTRRLMARSAFARYLVLNLQAPHLMTQLRRRNQKDRFQANVDVESVSRYRGEITEATAYLVDVLREENADRTIVFVMDAMRPAIYEGGAETGRVAWMHDATANVIQERDLPFVDLTGPFIRHYEETGERANSAYDAHWNETGHEVVADAVLSKLVELEVVSRPRQVAAGP